MATISRSYVNKHATHPLQTWEWAEFRREWGNHVLTTKYGVITIHPIPHTTYSIGTLIRGNEPTREMLEELRTIADKHKLIFIKIEPNVIVSSWQTSTGSKNDHAVIEEQTLASMLRENGCVPGKTLFTPTSFQIDVTKPKDKLMSGFSPKTRYNIRYAERKGVVVQEDNSDEAFETYLSLMRETVERQKFYAHSEKYHRLMWKHLHTDMVSKKKTASDASVKTESSGPIARLLTATYEGEIITAWIIFVWKDMMYYPYGASTERDKNVQANSAMMWNAILYAKKNKLKKFDLWGREEGKGFTKFKEGFSPTVVEFAGTWDLITSNLYKPYVILDRLRWKALRLRTKFTSPKF